MSEASRLNPDFTDVLRELRDAGAEFIVIGTHALAVHGFPRTTGALDVLVKPSPDNAARVLAALRGFGAPLAEHGVSAADLATEGTVYQIGLPPRRIDVLTQISGVTFDEAWGSRIDADLAGLRVPVLGRDALIRNKRAAGRDKDLLDLKLLGEPAR